MNSKFTETPDDSTEDLLLSVMESGVRLCLSNDQLTYKANHGAITSEQIKRLQTSRFQISTRLRQVPAFRSVHMSSVSRVDYAPLAFSQLMHWNLHQLAVRRSARIVASVVRLKGALDVDTLRTAIEITIGRHEALRTGIRIIGDMPVQAIFGSANSELHMDDLTGFPAPVRESELRRRIWMHILEPIDVTKDPLFSLRLVRLDPEEYALIWALDHMISDGISMAILLRDLFDVYESETSHRQSSLPEIPLQFADYAIWQRRTHELLSHDKGLQVSGDASNLGTLTIPSDSILDSSLGFGLEYVSVRIDNHLREELIRWSRLKKTTVVMGVFTAFAALVLRWCGASGGIIQYQTGGRSMVEVQNTVGYFAFRLYLCLCLSSDDTFDHLLTRAKAEYVAACERGEFHSMDLYKKMPEIARSPCFNWLVQDPIGSDLDCNDRKGGVSSCRIPFEEQLAHLDGFKTDTELMVGFRETRESIQGSVQFRSGMMSKDAAERFGRNLIAFVGALIGQSTKKIMQIELIA